MATTVRPPAAGRGGPAAARGSAPGPGRRSAAVACALAAVLLGLTLLLRTRHLDAGLWVDEGIAAGVAAHALADIPGVLAQDGSPPLYYMLLNLWTRLFGTGEEALRALSVTAAAACVPASLAAGWLVAGWRAGVLAAALAATVPFLTVYAQETRMYALVVLLGVIAAAAFVRAFVQRRRRWVPAFALLLAALLLTHNWGLFLAAAAALALVPLLRAAHDDRLPRDALAAFGLAALAYAPWVPTLAGQVRATGAPWARPPTPRTAWGDVASLWGTAGWIVLLAGVGAGLLALRRRGTPGERAAVRSLVILAVATPAFALAASSVAAVWAPRYLAMALGPALLLGGVALARAPRIGVAAAGVLVALGVAAPPDVWPKSNAREVARAGAPLTAPGDLVVSTQPEQVPVLAYHLGHDLRYLTPLGPVADPGVTDWRHALARLRTGDARRRLRPALDALPAGTTVLLVTPVPWTGTEWADLVAARSAEWRLALDADPRLRPVRVAGAGPPRGAWSALRVRAYRRV
ncbi:MAG TPA: glycosyltransferase family 39 protein [Miltoncostaeaceae bacterium]|nr:glycosyltransferase family 39 protein [Miltoncostaeaceae bacterium]